MDLKYRWIEGDELEILNLVLKERGWVTLDKALSKALIAEEDGRLVAFSVFQMIFHCGPLYVDKNYRGSGVPEELAARTMDYVHGLNCSGFLVVPDSKFSENLCASFGLTQLTQPVYLYNKEIA